MKAFFNWSGGKDSALALYHALKNGYPIEKLLTTVNSKQHRVSMHGVREELLEQQAASIGIPLQKIILPEAPSMQQYEQVMKENLQPLQKESFTHAIFGDIFLEDLKTYREQQLKPLGFTSAFPIWKRSSTELIREFINLGFKAIIVCVNTEFLDQRFCGRLIDESFLNDLPPNVDVCGENGEYHSFVFDGPLFSKPVRFDKGEMVYREYPSPKTSDCFTIPKPSAGFYFTDLIAVN